MRLFGLDYKQLLYHHNGQEQMITNGRPAKVVSEILEKPPETLS